MNLAPTSEPDFFVETGPTGTQKPINGQPLDKTTDSIRRLLKAHFDTEGVPQVESLDHLTVGRTQKQAAMFFYKTCGTCPYVLVFSSPLHSLRCCCVLPFTTMIYIPHLTF